MDENPQESDKKETFKIIESKIYKEQKRKIIKYENNFYKIIWFKNLRKFQQKFQLKKEH